MRKNITLYLNGARHELSNEHALMTVAEYLRYVKGLTGTKIVCSEGDCGACTILVARMIDGKLTEYKSINSCISYMYLLDRCHLVTVEGVGRAEALDPVQEAMVKCHGAQCGYCTPGIVCALAGMAQDLKKRNESPTEQKVKNYLSGNLCRCTGYEPIIKAGMEVDYSRVKTFKARFNDDEIENDLNSLELEVQIQGEGKEIYLPGDFSSAISYQDKNKNSKITSGATDLGVVQNKGRLKIEKSLSLNNISEAYQICETDHKLTIGAKVNLENLEKACSSAFPEFGRILHIFASPQIKNSGTLIGNLVNASPIADTTPFLRVAEAEVEIVSLKGERCVNINDFIKGGYKELDLHEGEIVKSISLPKTTHDFKLYKVSVRKDLDISTVTFACRYKIEGKKISDISFAMGGVGPIVFRLTKLEQKAQGLDFTQSNFKMLADEIKNEITPMSDHRGSSEFRYKLCRNLMLRFCDEVMHEKSLGFSEASV